MSTFEVADRWWQGLSGGAKGVSTLLGAVITVVTVWNVFDLPVPTTRDYVEAAIGSAKADFDNQIRLVQADAAKARTQFVNAQLQINELSRNQASSEKFALELRLQETTEPTAQQVIKQRLRALDDLLAELGRQREALVRQREGG